MPAQWLYYINIELILYILSIDPNVARFFKYKVEWNDRPTLWVSVSGAELNIEMIYSSFKTHLALIIIFTP